MMDRIDYDDSYCEQLVDKFLARCKKGEFEDEVDKRIYESLIPQTQSLTVPEVISKDESALDPQPNVQQLLNEVQ